MRYRYQSGDQVFEIALERQGDVYNLIVDGKSYACEVLDAQPGQISLRFEGRPLTVSWAADGGEKWLSLSGCTYHLERPSPQTQRREDEAGGGQSVRAPMPAQVREVQAQAGDRVEKGQTLLLLEAMKMEIRIRAPIAGQLKRMLVSTGDRVDKDQLLVEVIGESSVT